MGLELDPTGEVAAELLGEGHFVEGSIGQYVIVSVPPTTTVRAAEEVKARVMQLTKKPVCVITHNVSLLRAVRLTASEAAAVIKRGEDYARSDSVRAGGGSGDGVDGVGSGERELSGEPSADVLPTRGCLCVADHEGSVKEDPSFAGRATPDASDLGDGSRVDPPVLPDGDRGGAMAPIPRADGGERLESGPCCAADPMRGLVRGGYAVGFDPAGGSETAVPCEVGGNENGDRDGSAK